MIGKKIVLIFISIIPFWFIRKFLYRLVLDVKLCEGSFIGMLTLFNVRVGVLSGSIGSFNLINIDHIVIKRSATIGRFNKFNNINYLFLGPKSVILHQNLFAGTYDSELGKASVTSSFSLEYNSQISSRFIIDLVDEVYIGRDTVLGGFNTQLWTHAFDGSRVRSQGPIKIGDRCFFGSSVIVTHGHTVGSDVTVSAGTLIAKNIMDSGTYSSSSILKIKN
jgi:acetyltransferase-like isoleucine patch superfamily enzyme